jgi:hypothetical protein
MPARIVAAARYFALGCQPMVSAAWHLLIGAGSAQCQPQAQGKVALIPPEYHCRTAQKASRMRCARPSTIRHCLAYKHHSRPGQCSLVARPRPATPAPALGKATHMLCSRPQACYHRMMMPNQWPLNSSTTATQHIIHQHRQGQPATPCCTLKSYTAAQTLQQAATHLQSKHTTVGSNTS